MPGNERYLVPELKAFLLGKDPGTDVYLRAERFDGAKRGGSPNLAKLACACRLMHDHFGLLPSTSKLKFPDPCKEFAEWLEWELEKGFMWNEQGPSPNYDWMHLMPTIAFVINGQGKAKDLAEDWCRMFFKALRLGLVRDSVAQVGMRGVGHLVDDGFNRWMLELLTTGSPKNIYWKKHYGDNTMAVVLMKYQPQLSRLYKTDPIHNWKVRVEQHWYRFENGLIALLSKDGNGNTQARAADILLPRKRVIFPRDGGKRKQGKLDKMSCKLVQLPGNTLVVEYESGLYGKDFETIEGAGRLLSHSIWNSSGLRSTNELFETSNVPSEREEDQPVANRSKDRTESKGFFRRFLDWLKEI